MSLEALPGKKKQLTRRNPPQAWRDAVGEGKGLAKPQGEDSGDFQVHSQTGLSSATEPS